MTLEQADFPNPLAALALAFDELSGRPAAFHATARAGGAGRVRAWTVVQARDDAFDARAGRFTAPRNGHYLFMASAGNGACLRLLKNSHLVAEPLAADTPLLVAALQLRAGDIVTLHADIVSPWADRAIVWRAAQA